MKIIDFEKKGNVVRFYLGKDECDDYCGDDWEDRPYQHNAGRVYDKYIVSYVDKFFPFEYTVLEPSESWFENGWSKDDMKNQIIPCIVAIKLEDDQFDEKDFLTISANKKSKKYYLGMPIIAGWD